GRTSGWCGGGGGRVLLGLGDELGELLLAEAPPVLQGLGNSLHRGPPVGPLSPQRLQRGGDVLAHPELLAGVVDVHPCCQDGCDVVARLVVAVADQPVLGGHQASHVHPEDLEWGDVPRPLAVPAGPSGAAVAVDRVGRLDHFPHPGSHPVGHDRMTRLVPGDQLPGLLAGQQGIPGGDDHRLWSEEPGYPVDCGGAARALPAQPAVDGRGVGHLASKDLAAVGDAQGVTHGHPRRGHRPALRRWCTVPSPMWTSLPWPVTTTRPTEPLNRPIPGMSPRRARSASSSEPTTTVATLPTIVPMPVTPAPSTTRLPRSSRITVPSCSA